MRIKRRSVLELKLKTRKKYENPFLDVQLNCSFMSPSGEEYVMPGFYDGDGIWKVRFSPNEVGTWSCRSSTQVSDPDLSSAAQFEVVQLDKPVRGFLRTCPGKYSGLEMKEDRVPKKAKPSLEIEEINKIVRASLSYVRKLGESV